MAEMSLFETHSSGSLGVINYQVIDIQLVNLSCPCVLSCFFLEQIVLLFRTARKLDVTLNPPTSLTVVASEYKLNGWFVLFVYGKPSALNSCFVLLFM